jgi:hypothetical protein
MLRKSEKSFPNIWLHTSAFPYIEEKLLHFERDTELRLRKNKFNYVSTNGDFINTIIRNDFSSAVNTANGSIYASIYLAVYLGYKKIYLLGADYTKLPFTVGHFYDNHRELWDEKKVNELNSSIPLMESMKNKLSKTNDFANINNVEIINVIDENEESPYFSSIKFNELH